MLIIGLFTKYFLILMLIEGVIVGFIDARSFKEANMKDTARKARLIGYSFIALGLALYFIRMRLQ
jgi:hypothetical protein